MSVFLKQIEIINFKSYKGHVLVGPFRQFSAVIGPNGTGKSNFVDAISFVMGEKAFNLRVKNLGELIYGASLGLPDSPNQCTSVTAVFILARDETKSFTRSIKNSASVYQINETVVANTEYLEELKRIGINLKARNTLVPQGTIECIAMKDPKDLTALLEEISNSKELKPEYDSTWSKASEIENEGQLLLEKRRVFAAHKKAIVQQVEEFETYERLEEEYIEKQLTFYLFRLYYNEKDIKQLKSDKSEKRYELSKLEEKEREANEQLLKQKREFGKLVRELAKLEQDVREQEVEMSKKRSKFTERMQQKAYLQEKLESAQKSLEKARLEHEAHKEAIKELQNQLQEIERAKADYESSIETLSQSQGIDIQLMDEQLQEYRRLKARVGQQLTRYFQICDTLNREQKSMQDKLDNEIRKKTETEIKYQQKVHARDECIDRAKRLAEHINTLETNLKEQRALHEELERDIATSDEKIRQSQEQLENIFQQLNKAKANKDDMSRLKTKAEIIERLKNLYSGVYDRMHNLCQPFHSRYKIAVTKVFGKFIDAIVVDSERTATQCIKYLKEQLYCPETFLPLSNLLVESLKERLREIEEPRNVKLLYDVIQFTPSDVGRAVLFVTKNTLVCETPEDARKVAYEMDGNNVYDCVALDGTFFKKSGLISGGTFDLERRAQRWDEKEIAELKSRKEKLSQKIRDCLKVSKKKAEINISQSQIQGLEMRLKYSKNDVTAMNEQIANLKIDIEALKGEINSYNSTIAMIEKAMAEKNQKLQTISTQMNIIEDGIFASFCRRIGVNNIRQYEGGEMRSHQGRLNKRAEFEEHCNRIRNQLDFEEQRDTMSNILKWEKAVKTAEEHLESVDEAQAAEKADFEQFKASFEKLTSTCNEKSLQVDQKEKQLRSCTRAVRVVAKDIVEIQKQINMLNSKIEQKKAECHSIFVNSKLENIEVPVLQRNVELMSDSTSSRVDSSELDDEFSTTSFQLYGHESRVMVKYTQLPDNLKNLEANDVEEISEQYKKEIKDLQNAIGNIKAPNMRVAELFSVAKQQYEEVRDQVKEFREKAVKVRSKFEKIKKERIKRFMTCFEHVNKNVDSVFKALTMTDSAQAFLMLQEPEEPFSSGIIYSCFTPTKGCQSISNFSGGEKTMAALSLLFATHSYRPAPFIIFDEIDASLDNHNIKQVVHYIRRKSKSQQIIVVSHKNQFFSKAEALIGICSNGKDPIQSNVFTVDLTRYSRARKQ